MTEQAQKVVPRLRFPEFRDADPWEVKRLGEVAEIITGNTPSTSEPRNYGGDKMFVSPADISDDRYVENTKTTLSDIGFSISRNIPPNSVLFVCIGSTIGKVAQNRFECATNQQINSLVALSNFANDFLYYVLSFNSKKIAGIAGNQAVPIISKSLFSSIQVAIPSLPEQRKIADCLGSLDDLIRAEEAALEALKKHKKGLMQQLFPHEGETTPRLRFPEFRDAGEWTKQKLAALEKQGALSLGRGSVISKEDINRNPGSYPIYSSSIKNNGIFGYYGRYMFDEELITWSIDGGGNFFYRPKHKFSVTNVSGYMKLDTSRLDYRFLAYQLMLLHGRLQFDYLAKAHPSVIRELYSVAVPTLQEQKKIGDCLASLDDLIRARSKRIEALKQHKKGLMQQLFPQEVG